MNRSLILKISRYALSNLALVLYPWVVLKMAIGSGDKALSSHYIFITGLLSPIYIASTFGLRHIVLSNGRQVGKIAYRLRLLTIIVMCCLGVVATLVALKVSAFLGFMVAILIVQKIIDNYFDITYAYLLKQEHVNFASGLMFARGAVGISVFILFFKVFDFSFLMSLLISTIASVAPVIWGSKSTERAVGSLIPKDLFRKIKFASVPVLANGAFISLCTFTIALLANQQRYYLFYNNRGNDLEVYAIASYYLMAFNLFSQAVGQIFINKISILYRSENGVKVWRFICRTLLQISAILIAAATVFTLIEGLVTSRLYSNDSLSLSGPGRFFLLLCVISSFVASFLNAASIALRMYKKQVLFVCVALVLTNAISIMLVWAGRYNAASALAVYAAGLFTQAAVTVFYIRRRLVDGIGGVSSDNSASYLA